MVAVGTKAPPAIDGVRYLNYVLRRGNGKDTHPLALEFESKTLRGEACAVALRQLQAEGYAPRVVFCHPGWGEALYVKAVFPQARLVCLMEYYYHVQGQEMGFDPEFPMPGFAEAARLQTKNASLLLAMQDMDRGIAATPWQASRLPAWAQAKTTVLHEGIDTDEVRPNAQARIALPGHHLTVSAGDEVLTYVARNLEPVRGYHVFMRALPHILAARPNARVFIVGGDGVSYGARPSDGSYRQRYLAEVSRHIDPARVHFMGLVSRQAFLALMQITRCHVYLTYPFVLSWSLLEAMSAGATVVASDTPPVRDALRHGENGLLVPFFEPGTLAETVCEVLADPAGHAHLGRAARASIVRDYDLKRVVLPAYERLLAEMAA
ncbi:glycosyltransferase [Verticiella sediminum]